MGSKYQQKNVDVIHGIASPLLQGDLVIISTYPCIMQLKITLITAYPEKAEKDVQQWLHYFLLGRRPTEQLTMQQDARSSRTQEGVALLAHFSHSLSSRPRPGGAELWNSCNPKSQRSVRALHCELRENAGFGQKIENSYFSQVRLIGSKSG